MMTKIPKFHLFPQTVHLFSGHTIKWRKVTDLLVSSEALVTETNAITSLWVNLSFLFVSLFVCRFFCPFVVFLFVCFSTSLLIIVCVFVTMSVCFSSCLYVCYHACVFVTSSLFPDIQTRPTSQLHNTYKYMYYTMSDGSVTRCSMEGKSCKVIYSPIDHGGYKVHAVTSDPRTKSIYLSTARYFGFDTSHAFVLYEIFCVKPQLDLKFEFQDSRDFSYLTGPPREEINFLISIDCDLSWYTTIIFSTHSFVLKTDLEGKDPITHVSHKKEIPSQPAAVAGKHLN